MSEPMEEIINPAEPPPQKSKKTLIIIILALIIVIGGGGGGFYIWSSSTASATEDKSNSEDGKKKKESKKPDLELEDFGEEPEEAAKEDSEDGEKKVEKTTKNSVKDALRNSLPDDEDVKHIIELEPFIVNLADEDETRYLRMTIHLGIGEAEEKEPDKLFLTRVKNAMLAVISVKTSEDVLTVKGKNKLRKELLKAAQMASDEPSVEAIYITDFIVQL